jgi:hypothetical protein
MHGCRVFSLGWLIFSIGLGWGFDRTCSFLSCGSSSFRFPSIPVDSPLLLPALVPLLFDLVFPFFCLADLALSLC